MIPQQRPSVYLGLFFLSSQQKETLLKPQGQEVWAGGRPAGRGGGRGALFYLLLGARVAGVAILLLAAVGSTGMQGMQAGVTLAADHLVSVLLLGELAEGGLDDATPQVKHQVPGGLFLGIIV